MADAHGKRGNAGEPGVSGIFPRSRHDRRRFITDAKGKVSGNAI